MGVTVGYNVCFPPDYARSPGTRYPVIYYLHGYEGNESSFLDYAEYWKDSLSRSGPSILVFVNGGETSFFSDAPDGSVMGETVVVKELVPEVDSHLRTIAKPAARSLHGYSMGGFGALKLAFKHPDLFGSVVSYAATLSTAAEMQKHLGKVYGRMFGSSQRFAENDPLALLDAPANEVRSHVAVEIIVGAKDEFLPANRRLNERMNALRIPHRYIELPGVKHDKEPLYEHAAADAFEFTARAFRGVR